MVKKSFFMILFLMCIAVMCISAQIFVIALEVPKSQYYPDSNENWWQYQFEGYVSDYYGDDYHKFNDNTNCGPACTAMVINYFKGVDIVTTAYQGEDFEGYPEVNCEARWNYCEAKLVGGFYSTDWHVSGQMGATADQIINVLSSEGINTEKFTGYDFLQSEGGGMVEKIKESIGQGLLCICKVNIKYYIPGQVTDHTHWVVAYGYDDNNIYLNDPGYKNIVNGQGLKVPINNFADALWEGVPLSILITCGTIIESLAPPPEHVYPLNNSTIYTTTPTFQWNSVSNADGYGLYIKDIASNEMVYETGEQPLYGTSLELPGGILEDGRSYWWNMNSYNNAGWNPECSSHWKFTVQVDNYPTVNSFSVNPTSVTLGDSFNISYSVSDDVGLSWVELWRTNDKNGQPDENGWTQIGPQYSISGKSYSGEFHDSPSLFGIYWYGIHVVDTSGLCSVEPDPPGPIMVTVTDPTVNPPTGVQASDGNYTDKVRINWNSVSGASYYHVYRATSSGGSKISLGSWQGSITYDDTSATPGQNYYYFVKAATSSSGSNASDYSAYNEGWRKLSPPTGVNATDGTYTDKIRITWNSVSGASYYHVYRATSSGDSKISLGSWQGSITYDDTSATPGQNYYYFVKAATNSSGYRESDYSTYDQGSCSVPTNLPQVTMQIPLSSMLILILPVGLPVRSGLNMGRLLLMGVQLPKYLNLQPVHLTKR